MLGKAIVVFLSVLLFVATELFFPIDGNNALAVKQKHFWATIFLIFSLVLGLPIEGTLEMERKVDEVKEAIVKHEADSALQVGFHELHDLYGQNFNQAPPVLKGWADELLKYIHDNFSQGVIPLPRELAPMEIGKVYQYAQQSMLATNVGSTKFYFDVQTYVASNKTASARGVPVIRFFLYGDRFKDHIEMRDGRHPQNIDDYFKDVAELHHTLGALYSVVIDVDKLDLEQYRDLLIMDNGFMAETLISQETWQPIRALATQHKEQLDEGRKYFRRLIGAINDRYVLRMRPEEVKAKFSKNKAFTAASLQSADSLFSYMIGQVTGTI